MTHGDVDEYMCVRVDNEESSRCDTVRNKSDGGVVNGVGYVVGRYQRAGYGMREEYDADMSRVQCAICNETRARQGRGHDLATILAREEEEPFERLVNLYLHLDILLLAFDDSTLDALLLLRNLQDRESHGIVGVAPGRS